MITISKDGKIITLHTASTTYQMAVGPYDYLLHVYYGPRVESDMSYIISYVDRSHSPNPYEADYNKTFSLDTLPQEYPCYGNGDFRNHAVRIQNHDQSYGICLKYKSAKVLDGKYSLPGMPAVYANEKAQTLEVILEDAVSNLEVTLLYGVMEECDVITRAVKIRNRSSVSVRLEKAASCSFDMLYGSYDLICFHGRHGMERIPERDSVTKGKRVLESRRGTSSHHMNPFFILAQEETTETHGECYGFSLLYSGNFKAEVEQDQVGLIRCMMGLHDECFSWKLQPGEEFTTPEAAMSYSREGLEKLSHNYHRLIRHHVCRGPYKTTRRPVLINNWEATYFDFTGEKILNIAKQAAELGVEMLVLDDGWFGKRNGEKAGLGDWYVNEEKLGGTLAELSEGIHTMGMKFGLWIEPEMVNEDSDLYRAHPDWAFTIPRRKPNRGRYQLVLDFSRKEVVDYIFEQISFVVERSGVDYIKMDMNRNLTDIYSVGAQQQNQGVILHKYVLGVYDFLERMLARFPDILIEGCSGGGGRFDAGMLYYTPQIWCSDNTDAIDRTRIQHGTSFGYPISAVGSHVSAVPNHQTGRITNIQTRAVVAMAGSFGYELDLNLITDDEKELVKAQIKDYIRYWDMIQNGSYYRLTDPQVNREIAAWAFVAEDRSEALLNVVTLDAHCNAPIQYVRLRGLDPQAVYSMEGTEKKYSGAALMYAGIQVPELGGQYQAWQVRFYVER